MKRTLVGATALALAGALAFPVLSATAASAANKAGGKCKKLGEVSGNLTCTAKGKTRVWTATPATAAPTTVASGGDTATTPPAPAGLATVPGFDGKTISIGYLGNVSVNAAFPASASFADGGQNLTAGFNAYISRVNDAGGIAGKYKINSIFKEMYYTPSEAVKAYAEIKNSVVMMGQVYGTPSTQALDKSFAEDGLVGSPISLLADWVKDPNYLPVGSTYQQNAINLVEYYVKEGGGAGKTICSIALANNAYGQGGEDGFDFATKNLTGFKPGIKIKTSTSAAAAQALKDGKCDAVVATISGELQTAPLMAAMAQIDFFPQILALGPSFSVKAVIPANSAAWSKQVIVSTDSPTWGDERAPGMKQFIGDMKKYAPYLIGNPNTAAIWGYVQAQIDVALLEKAVAMGDLSKAGIKKAMASLGKVNLGGLFPEYTYGDPASRVAPAQSNIARVDISVRGGLEIIKPFTSSVTFKLG